MDREQCVRRAVELGIRYVPVYWGCAQTTFCAIVDALRSEGLQLVTPEVQEQIVKGLVGLSGGVGNLGRGNCGALTGAAVAISLVSRVGRKEIEQDPMYRWIAYDNVAETIGQRFLQEFHGLSCRDVTWTRWGKWYDSWNPAIKAEFVAEERSRGCLGTPQCTQAMVAGWATEYILDICQHPRTLDKVKADHS